MGVGGQRAEYDEVVRWVSGSLYGGKAPHSLSLYSALNLIRLPFSFDYLKLEAKLYVPLTLRIQFGFLTDYLSSPTIIQIASVLQMIILSLLLHPKAQDTAHQQIRHHLSSKRPVTLDDRPNLPYIDMIIRETLRWHPVLPLGLARCSVKEDVYKGYRIPKGTVVLPNVWYVSLLFDAFRYRES